MDQGTLLANKRQLMELASAGKLDQAFALAQQLSAHFPQDAELNYALAQLQEAKGLVEPAIQSYMKAVSMPSPIIKDALGRLVNICLANGFERIALEPARMLARVHENSAQPQYQLAVCLIAMDQLLEAKHYLQRSLELDPKLLAARWKLADMLLNLGEVRSAIDMFKQAAREDGKPDASEHWCLNYLSGVDEQKVAQLHRRYAAAIEAAVTPEQIVSSAADGRPLKIGLMSKDFCSHSVAWFIKPLMRNKGAADWHLTAYSTGQKQDLVTHELQCLCDEWRQVANCSNDELLEKIRADRIDVLIDLVGYAGDARLSVFARRASAIQVTYLGYPNTTGLTQMDYRMTDVWSDPPGMTERYYSEELLRLPGGFLSFEPHSDSPAVVSRAEEAARGVVFGSFNVHHKISERAFDCWAEALKAVQGSTMILKSRPLADPAFRELFWKRFEEQGIERERIMLRGHTPGKQEHLALYNEVDINLDTYPYNGTTTTCEALWQGVPTLTLAGDTHRSRVGCSILSQLGLEDWIAGSEAEFVQIAVNKAADIEGLAALRKGMRDRMRSSPLLDGSRLVREMDQVFREIIERKSAS